MQESERFVASLFPATGPKLQNLKFFPGEDQVTLEDFSKETRSAFLLVDTGQSVGADSFPETLTRISVDRFVAGS